MISYLADLISVSDYWGETIEAPKGKILDYGSVWLVPIHVGYADVELDTATTKGVSPVRPFFGTKIRNPDMKTSLLN